MKYEYILPEHGEEYPTDALEFTASHVSHEYIAEDAAEWFHHNNDGWDYDWPVVIEIFKNAKSLGKFDVERESVPQFNATPIKSKNNAEIV